MKSKPLLIVYFVALFGSIMGCSDSDTPMDVTPTVNQYDTTGVNGNDSIPNAPNLTLAYGEFLGCVQQYKSSNSVNLYDTLYYEIMNDTLVVHVTLYKNCAACMTDSLVISEPQVSIYVRDTCGLVVYCLCYFKFDYYFSEYSDGLTFHLYYKPFDEEEFEFWTSLNYP